MIIRKFKIKDAESLANLSKLSSKEIGLERETAKDFIKLFNRSKNLIWIAEEKNKIVGFLYGDFVLKKGILESKKSLELAVIYILKEYRSRGIAKKLVKKFLNSWKNTDHKIVFSFANKKALNLLKSFGFKEKHYYLEKKLWFYVQVFWSSRI